MITRKICLVGDYGVGKTSLIARFVRNVFSEAYLTTIGVKVDIKQLTLDDSAEEMKIVIWDIAGSDEMSSVNTAYLRGAAGFILVVDGTRSHTLETALKLQQEVQSIIGEVPFVGLINKADKVDDWEIDESARQELEKSEATWLDSSAKTGLNVELAFQTLAKALR